MNVQEEPTEIRPTNGANTFTSKEQDRDTGFQTGEFAGFARCGKSFGLD
jgi:hypothetical protein